MKPWLALLLIISSIAACSSSGTKSAKNSEAELAGIYADIGLGALQRGDFPRAKEKLDQALELDPKLARAHHYIAELYTRTENYVEAEGHYRQALRFTPDDADLQNNFAAFLCNRERLDEAEKLFLKAIANPQLNSPAWTYENLGNCTLRRPDAAKAEGYFEQALKFQPTLPISLYRMAVLQFDKKEYFKARAYLERYSSVGEMSAEVLWLGVRIERQLGDTAQVAKYGELLKRRFADAPETALFYGLSSGSGAVDTDSQTNTGGQGTKKIEQQPALVPFTSPTRQPQRDHSVLEGRP